jgi:P pilus assembly chaperone PapD
MVAPQIVSTTLGLSMGTVLTIAGIVVIGTVIYYNNKKKNDIVDVENLSSEKEKYETNKWIVEDAINKNNIEKLERLLNNQNIIKYNDLSMQIKDFLKKNND